MATEVIGFIAVPLSRKTQLTNPVRVPVPCKVLANPCYLLCQYEDLIDLSG